MKINILLFLVFLGLASIVAVTSVFVAIAAILIAGPDVGLCVFAIVFLTLVLITNCILDKLFLWLMKDEDKE